MGERTLDAIAGIIFIILILGMQYWQLDIFDAIRPFIWVFAIIFHAYIFGKNVFPSRHWLASAPFGLLLLIAVQCVAQVIWFYIGAPLGGLSDAWSLAIAIAASHLSGVTAETVLLIAAPPLPARTDWTRKRIILASLLGVAALAAFVFVVMSAWNARTLESIRTPWPLLDAGVLPAIALLWISAILSAMSIKSITLTTVHTMLAIGATLAIAPIIYVLGYGFDSFLHIAGEEVLIKTGSLDPKPFYYMGQYVLTTWLSRIFDLPLILISKWLVPVSASIILPASVAFAYQRFDPDHYAALILALVPMSMFVASTPQGFAAVIGFSAVILAIGSAERHIRITGPMWLGIWSILIHPLAGIPLLLFAVALMIRRKTNIASIVLSYAVAATCGLAIPVIFFIASYFLPSMSIEWDFSHVSSIKDWASSFSGLIPWLPNKYVLWPAFSSLIMASLPAIGLILAIIGFFLPIKVKRRTAMFMIGAGSMMFSAGLLEHASDFSFLIQYEKGDYANRLMQLGIILLMFAGVPTISFLLNKIRSGIPIASLIVMLFIGAIGAANAHNALPRHDSVEPSRGWSTGRAEIEAVKWIDRSAKDEIYTVLANQSVSAAAIKEFGFKRYTTDEVFFYPIPTGGPLYQIYLKMSYEDPSIETVREASRLGKSDLVYVVINDYWWKAEELNEKISTIANEEWSIDNGKIMIYKFDFAE
ncbi:MAG: hypothetical protein P1P90_00545 [Patescibacteria group bacterium]|nr:hypothetical protein [Patescibacteria group bacterium]